MKRIVIMKKGTDLIVSTFNTFDPNIDSMNEWDLFDLLHFHFEERVDLDDPERFGLLVNKDFFKKDGFDGLKILRVIEDKDL